MSESVVDEIAPSTLAQQDIALSMSPQQLIAGNVLLVDIDYSAVGEEGLVLPLIYTVTQPDGSKLIRQLITLALPKRLTFQPEVPGNHFVRLGEAFHNRTWGGLVVEVLGSS